MSNDASVFTATVDAEGGLCFDFPGQQRAYCKRRLVGQPVDVIVAPAGAMKTRLMEKGFHAMLAPWVKEGHQIEALKYFLKREIFGLMEVPHPVTGEIMEVLREPHTSKLNRAQYCELIERTIEIAAECGVILEAPHEYRERKEREQRKGRAA